MEFNVEKNIFLKSISKILGVVEKRNTIPILSNILIDTVEGKIRLTATDLEIASRVNFNAEIKQQGNITVNAKKFFEIIKELPEGIVSIYTKDNCWIEIRGGKSIFNIVGLSSDEFPFFPDYENVSFTKIDSLSIKKLIEKTVFSSSNDESKYNLNGIHVVSDSDEENTKIKFVATDGHRLALCSHSFDKNIDLKIPNGIILPKKGVYEIKKITDEYDEIDIGFFENNAVILTEDSTLVMRLIDGDFPDYQRVIPSENSQKMIVDRNQFIHSLRRISILSADGSRGVKLHLSQNGLEISSSNPEYGEAKENLDIDYSSEEVSVGFNAKYILDILSVVEAEQVEFAVKDQLSPGLIKESGSDKFLAVVMPMRL